MAFHGSLLFTTQLLDELPMLWATLMWVYVLLELRDFENERFPLKATPVSVLSYSTTAKISIIFGVLWTSNAPWLHYYYPIAWQGLFAVLILSQFHYMYWECKLVKSHDARLLLTIYFCSAIFAVSFWVRTINLPSNLQLV